MTRPSSAPAQAIAVPSVNTEAERFSAITCKSGDGGETIAAPSTTMLLLWTLSLRMTLGDTCGLKISLGTRGTKRASPSEEGHSCLEALSSTSTTSSDWGDGCDAASGKS